MSSKRKNASEKKERKRLKRSPSPECSTTYNKRGKKKLNQEVKRSIESSSTESSSSSQKNTNLTLNNKHQTEDNALDGYNLLYLSEINPYQSRWKVKVKVLIKRPVYFWENEKGSGNYLVWM